MAVGFGLVGGVVVPSAFVFRLSFHVLDVPSPPPFLFLFSCSLAFSGVLFPAFQKTFPFFDEVIH